jgi:DNA-binding MarR family transcriptional regulator
MSDATPTVRLDDLIGYNLRRASALMLSDFGDMFSGTFVRPTSFSVACVIDEQPGITSAEICRLLGLQRANIVALLTELDEHDIIRRRDDDEDKRIQRLYLNPEARDELDDWRAMATRHEERMLARLSSEERVLFLGMLRRIWREQE